MTTDINRIKITCPRCGAEYLPSELFIPKFVFGKPTDIERTDTGKLLWCDGQDMDLQETYKCDYCNKPFEIKAIIKFESYIDDRKDFTSDYSTSLKVKKYTLFDNDKH